MKDKEILSDKAVAYSGALLATAAVFAYSLIVMLYVIVYSSTSIYAIMPTSERNHILVMSEFSVAYSVVVFSLVMVAPSLVVGSLVAIVLKRALIFFNPSHNPKKAFLLSSMTAFSATTLAFFMLFLKGWATFSYSETISFWFYTPH